VKPRRHPSETRTRAPGAWRRLGRLGAAAALAVQLLLPFMAMKPAAPDARAEGVLAQAVAAWGRGALCTPDAAAKDHGRAGPLAAHPCPICWAVQQTAGLLPPDAIPEPAPRAFARLAERPRTRGDLRPLLPSPAQPRAPPFV